MKHVILTLLPLSVLVSGLTACETVDQPDRRGSDRPPYYEPRPVYSDYDYDFYPNVGVYFQVSTGFYYFQDRGRWVRARQLPPYVHLDSRYRKQMHIRDPYPYMHYEDHARKYGHRDDDRGRWEEERRGRGRDDDDKHGYDRDRDNYRQPPPVENRGDDRKGPKPPDTRKDDDRRDGDRKDDKKDDKKDAKNGKPRIPGSTDNENNDFSRWGTNKGDSGNPSDPYGNNRYPGSTDNENTDFSRYRTTP